MKSLRAARQLEVAFLAADRWPGRHLAASRSSALAKTPRTPTTPRIAPAWRFAPATGPLGQRASCALRSRATGSPCNGRDARCPSGFAQANSQARKPTLPQSWVSWVSRVSWPAHLPMKSPAGGPPTSSGTPFGRPSHWKAASLWTAAILAACRWPGRRPNGQAATGPPSASPLAPRASGFAVRASVRAPLARHWPAFGPCRGTKGFYLGKRPGKRPAPGPKIFFNFFSQTPLRTLRRCGKLAAVQRPE